MTIFRTMIAVAALSACATNALADDIDILTLPGGKTLAVPGFRMYIATGYVPSEKNIEFLKALKEKMASTKLVAFDAAKSSKNNMLLCRGSFPVYGPNKTPFASLVEAAVNMELVAAGLATPDAQHVQASLDDFDFSSFPSGKWTIKATLASEGRPSLVVTNVHAFPVSAMAVSGCNDVMKALPEGIEAFLFRLYSDPGFVELMQ